MNHRFAVFDREFPAIPVIASVWGAFGRFGPDCFPFCVHGFQRLGLRIQGRSGDIAATVPSIAVASVCGIGPSGGKTGGATIESGEMPLQDMQGKRPGLTTLRYGLLLAVSLATLTGCVSAVSSDMRADLKPAQEEETAAGDDTAETTTPVASAGGGVAETAGIAEPAVEGETRDLAGAVMQPTTLNAGKASIYSNGGQAVPAGTAYAGQTTGANATVNSLYAGADQAGRLPVEDMPTVGTTADQVNIPVPKTGRTALVEEAAAGNAADMALAEAAGEFDGERFAQKPRRVLNRDSANATQMASLGTLPGVKGANALLSTAANDHSEAEEIEDDAPQFKEVASLAGLARLAPNGLWLQTEKVKTGCFKPELLEVLKTVEKHYDKPIIVTSGRRDIKVNRARQSLHTRCEAADIQIAGVSKWELAEYLRTMPGRGGVGTYCHTESVHIDIGPARDWNWRCRRRK